MVLRLIFDIYVSDYICKDDIRFFCYRIIIYSDNFYFLGYCIVDLRKVFWLVLENVKVICKIFVKFFWLFNGFFNIKRYYSDIYLEYLKKKIKY